MNFVASIGQRTLNRLAAVNYLAATVGSLFRLACCPSHWPRTTRNVFARQLLFTGVEALGFIALIAFMVGISVIAQAQLWLGKAGQTALLGKILVIVILRELAPLLVNFVVIGRSGNAIATELANMKINGEVNLLESQGIDPLLYLAMPRVLATALSVLCLTIWFVVLAFIGGYGSGVLLKIGTGDPAAFVTTIFQALKPADIINLLLKTLISGTLTAVICITKGLSVEKAVTEVPQAATQAVVSSIAALFVVSAVISVMTYV